MMGLARNTVLMILFCSVLFFYQLDSNDLWSSHEARAAQNAQRMLDDDSWVLPQLYDGQVELQKPPGFYWMVAAVAWMRDRCVDRWSVRIPPAVCGLATVLMIYAFLVRRERRLAGILSGVILAGSIHFTSLSRTGRIDMPLTCFVTASMLLLSECVLGVRRIVALGVLFALAILLKGPIGVVLPLGAAVLWSRFAVRTDSTLTRHRFSAKLFLSVLVGVCLASPWFLWANHLTNGEFCRVFFIYHNFQRAMGNSAVLAVHPWWYYLPRFAFDFLPWTPVFAAALAIFISKRVWRIDQTATFGLVWFIAMLFVLSCSRFKRADYLLPAFPGAAIFLGCMAERWHQQLSRRSQTFVVAGFIVLIGGLLAGWSWYHRCVEPRQEAVREQQGFAEYVREHAPVPNTLVFFRVESHLLAFHVHRPINTLVEWDDLNKHLLAPGPHYIITRSEFLPECRRNVTCRRIEVVAYSEYFCHAPPLRPLALIRTID